ncbi:MAG TPA: sigma-54 dependent transcriptional regulator [Longimicrobiales bacterium]|jgi:two-component system nitrogen regulation response regulator NtrX
MDVLIVDDEGNIRRMIRALLEAEGYRVREADTAEAALVDVAASAPEAVLLDLALPGRSGLEALPDLMEAAPGVPVVMMSGQATLSDAVAATRLGAFHFLEKPLTPEAVLVTLRGAMEVSRARDLSRALRRELGPEAELVGDTPGIAAVRDVIRKAAPTEARVLITGESGTGKELAATAIHGLSKRRGAAFVRVNSAAIPRDLVESEMFGHERGAFTGATERRHGRFEMADGGTLFLDEVADLGPEAQAKLLRVLENGVVERVGGSAPIKVDVRVIAATNKDLRHEIEEGRFRQDLLFRLDVVPLRIPPLRDRRADIPMLVEFVLERLRLKHGLTPPRLGPDAIGRLQAHPWPGNVRELFNIVERLTILSPGSLVTASDVARVLPSGSSRTRGRLEYVADDPRPLRDRLDEYERTLINGALDATEGNVAEAGRNLRTDRANLYRRMKRLGLRDG